MSKLIQSRTPKLIQQKTSKLIKLEQRSAQKKPVQSRSSLEETRRSVQRSKMEIDQIGQDLRAEASRTKQLRAVQSRKKQIRADENKNSLDGASYRISLGTKLYFVRAE
ncbi:hypothetical protein F511_11175 [Dorcoceras hygrometricum]|uniref:Uncharacterized protein n=1 Tax=Dorcoceras hygrometricum TaxID=472368 RepID=A0A2Z7B9E3_9LAMI|nr:hypothetical protein F511_11175 [Dorcoceras hygrometricum]